MSLVVQDTVSRSGNIFAVRFVEVSKMSHKWCVKVRSGIARIYRDGKPLSNSSGEEYGHILRFSSHLHTESQKQLVKVSPLTIVSLNVFLGPIGSFISL